MTCIYDIFGGFMRARQRRANFSLYFRKFCLKIFGSFCVVQVAGIYLLKVALNYVKLKGLILADPFFYVCYFEV